MSRGTRLVVAACGAWLVFVTAFLVLTGEHWWWRLVELPPPLTFVAVPLLLLALAPLARPARGGVALVAVASLALGVDLAGFNLHALAPRGDPAAAATGTRAVRVFSWNTEFWHTGQDADRFYRLLKEQNADVYLLQEYVDWDRVGHRPVRLDDFARLRAELPDHHIAMIGELITLSRFPIAGQWPLDAGARAADPGLAGAPAGADFPEYYRHKVLRTDLRVGDRILSTYNVHMPVQVDISEDPGSADFYRFMRAQQQRRLGHYAALHADLEANSNPVLIAGDFNATSAMGELRRLGRRVRDASPASNRLYLASWPAGGTTLWRVDWAFTAGLHVHEYRMLPTAGLSDHLAQVLVTSW